MLAHGRRNQPIAGIEFTNIHTAKNLDLHGVLLFVLDPVSYTIAFQITKRNANN